MAARVDVAEFDLSEFREELRHISRVAPKAVARALNRGLLAARTEGARQAAKQLGIPVGKVKKRLWQKKASRGVLQGTLTAGTRRIPLRGRQTKRGVTTGRGQFRKLHERAWVPMSRPNIVLQRKGVPRYPIRVVTGPSVAEAWTPQIESIERAGIAAMKKTLDHEIERMTQ